MSQNTPIQWCDSTVNPVAGCSGCELWTAQRKTCYAGQLHKLRRTHKGFSPNFNTPKLFPGRMAKAAQWRDLTGTTRPDKPWLKGMARLVFVSDMGDALSERKAIGPDNKPLGGGVPFAFLKAEIVDAARSPSGRRHHWLWLTKRPHRLGEFCRWLRRTHGLELPRNIWVGTTVTGKTTLGRIADLQQVGGKDTLRFVSVEPLWEAIRLAGHLAGISWVIVGGESQQGAEAKEFKVEWARALRRECAAAGVAFFLKQLGSLPTDGGHPLPLADGHGGDMQEWPRDLRVRELPPIPRTATPVGPELRRSGHRPPTGQATPIAPPKAKQTGRATLPQLQNMAQAMFTAVPVWSTVAFDKELTDRWEKQNGRRVQKYEALRTGRNRFLNMVDWVKAHYTMAGKTFTVQSHGVEYRIWVEAVGFVRGERLVPATHMENVISGLLRLEAEGRKMLPTPNQSRGRSAHTVKTRR